MVELSDLEINVLEFLHKSFGFDRLTQVGETEYAVFTRRETEDESKLRPKLVRLFVVLPRDRILYDLAGDILVIAPDGAVPGPRTAGTAHEAAAESTEFTEQGIPFRTQKVPNGIAYLPRAAVPELTTPAALAALGLA